MCAKLSLFCFPAWSLQLRDCLEADVYELFHKKLTEHALMKDPKFLWCCHVSPPLSRFVSFASVSFVTSCSTQS